MKKNNSNIITSLITASLLLLATGCSQSAETVNVTPNITTTDSTAATTINTEAETPKETTAVTVAQTTAQITTAAATTVITTAPVTEAQPVTKQAEVQEAPVITTTTTTKAAPVITTTTTISSAPKQEEPEDRSYLNLSPSEVQGILDECQRYAESLGYRVLTYSQYKIEEEEYDRKQKEILDNDGSRDELDKLRKAWKTDLKCITNVDDKDFWYGDWHYIMYAGNYTGGVHTQSILGYEAHSSTKEESINWLIGYLKSWIDDERSDHYQTGGRSISITGTKLRTFDSIAQEIGDWGVVSYEDIHREYSTYTVYDLDTSYAFSVKAY